MKQVEAIIKFFKVLDKFIPPCVSPGMEVEGLDQSEVSITAYP